MALACIHDNASQLCSSLAIIRNSWSRSQTKDRQMEKLHPQDTHSLVGFRSRLKSSGRVGGGKWHDLRDVLHRIDRMALS